MKNQQTKPNTSASTVLWIIVSLIAAIMLWVYVTENEGTDITRTIPNVQVSFNGEASLRENREMIVSEVSTTSVNVTVSGNRRTVSALNAENMSAVIDLSRITRTGNYAYSPSISLPSRTDTSAISAIVTDPGSVGFYVDKLAKKTVAVEGVFSGSAAKGYSADPMSFSPSTVIVYGPEKVLASVDRAYVEVTRTDVDRTLSFESTYVLLDAEGNEFENDELTFSDETVTVTLPIRAVKEVSLTVELVAGGGATESNVKWKLEPSSVILTGDADVLSGVNSITVARIDLAEVEDALTESYRIEIPNNTEVTSGTRETTLTLELTGLYSQSFTIEKNNISCINVSEGYVADVMDRLSGVVIRGPEEIVTNLSSLNVRAVADLKNYGTATGIVTVPVQIVISGTTEAGAVGEYMVYINISEAPEEPEED